MRSSDAPAAAESASSAQVRRAPSRRGVRRALLAGLGLTYVCAFVSLAVQIVGLVGSSGILPNRGWFSALAGRGDVGFADVPSLCWGIGCSDATLLALAWGGALAGVMLIVGVLPWLSAFVAFAAYLSLCGAGQLFLNYQWDALLLEAGFLALLLAPPDALGPRSRAWEREPPALSIWLFRWLLFRLVWSSGIVKLASGDATWWNLTALHYHYETQPLPMRTSWWMHQLPLGAQRFATFAALACELCAPLGYLGPRRVRQVAAAVTTGLMLLIGATGNYGFFNLLTLVLCLSLLDDDALPRRLRVVAAASPAPRWGRRGVWALGTPLVLLSLAPFLLSIDRGTPARDPLIGLYRLQRGFHLVGAYGLFAVMTTERPEVTIEGTLDGETWQPYAFRWKPGDPQRAPRFSGPHMPRLDWQLWFAALEGADRVRWLRAFASRLLDASPDVLALLADDPFRGRAPKGVRVRVDDYHFTSLSERRATGDWWKVDRGREAFEVRRDDSQSP
jgi:hypothetical protein